MDEITKEVAVALAGEEALNDFDADKIRKQIEARDKGALKILAAYRESLGLAVKPRKR